MGTWNVGGLTAQNVLELTKSFAGDRDLEKLQVLMLQEVIVEPGVQFLEEQGWTMVCDKNLRDWRGTAIAFRSTAAKHTNSALLPGGIATTLTQANPKQSTRYISGHIPHHATIAQTETLLGGWRDALDRPKVVVGFDANETFSDPDDQGWRAHTGRGEVVLATMAEHSIQGPPQDLHIPTYHPYNTAMESRRLDYVMVKGHDVTTGGVKAESRHMASSDHDLVLLGLTVHPQAPNRHHKPTWGGRRYIRGVDPKAAASQPPTQTDTHTAITQLAQRITEHGRPSQRFHESQELRQLRQQARQAKGMVARGLWKQVSRQRKREHRAWQGELVLAASQANWGAYRALQQTTARVGWQHTLMDDAQWRSKLTSHFRGIFAKAPAARTRRRLQDTRGALERICKRTPWMPFTGDDLLLATRTWKHNKATGPDSITHELLRQLLQEPAWEGRILHIFNDFLYKIEIPAPVLQGMTILLPKTQGDPPTWGDTRPITLSSAVLKWFAQLLLLRGGETTRCALPVGRQGQASARAAGGAAKSGETRQRVGGPNMARQT